MNKVSLTLLLILCSVYSLFAQYSASDYDSEQFAKFLKTKTWVVLTGKPSYDLVLKEAVKTYWKYTKYEFIAEEDLNTYLENGKYSFLMPINIEVIRSNDIGTYIQRYHYLAVFLGGKSSLLKYDKNDLLAYSVFDFEGREADRTYALYRLPLMIKTIHDAISITERERLKGNPKKLQASLTEVYNKKARLLTKKTLLINQDYFDKGFDQKDFANTYPLKWELADKKKIEKAIKEKDPTYAFLVVAETTDKHMFVFDCATGEVVYAAYKASGKMFVKSGIKKLLKTIS